jgi:two-component system response regulator RegX3
MTNSDLTRVLVVEDDPSISTLMRMALRREGYEVRQCETGKRTLELVRAWQPELILLDLGLPDADGRDLTREIRSTSDVPLIMVTGRSEGADKVSGLELGADDYIVKPFDLPELLSRIRAVLRRSRPRGSWSTQRLQNGPLVLDIEQRRALLDGKDLNLSNKEFEILHHLMENPGRVIRRGELASAVWGTTSADVGKSLDVHVSWLRGKLGDNPRCPTYIETLRHVGFRLITAV